MDRLKKMVGRYVGRRLTELALAIVWLGVVAGSAHAHGTMPDADEFGPPMMISGALGILGYLAMMLAPAGWLLRRRQGAQGSADIETPRPTRHVAKAR